MTHWMNDCGWLCFSMTKAEAKAEEKKSNKEIEIKVGCSTICRRQIHAYPYHITIWTTTSSYDLVCNE